MQFEQTLEWRGIAKTYRTIQTKGTRCPKWHMSCYGACKQGLLCHIRDVSRGRWRWREQRYQTKCGLVFHLRNRDLPKQRTNLECSKSSKQLGHTRELTKRRRRTEEAQDVRARRSHRQRAWVCIKWSVSKLYGNNRNFHTWLQRT